MKIFESLDNAQRRAYARDGFLVLKGFVGPDDCDALMARAAERVAGFEPDPALGPTVFSARAQSHAADVYFRESGDKVRFFFEPDAFSEDGRPLRDTAASVNKIGHALHDLDPVFERFSRAPRLAALAADPALGLAEPLLVQSMYIYKQPGIGAEVGCHQDSCFLYTEPLSCVGLWFALEDATVDNGCLWAIPGRGPLRRRFRYRGGELVMETLDDSPWPMARAVPLEVPRGTLIVLDGLLAHYSGPNRSPRSRQAYTLHLIDGACAYPADNWLRRGPELPLKGF